MDSTMLIVERANLAANDGLKVLILYTSERQMRALKALVPLAVQFARWPAEEKFDLVLDDR